MLEPIVRRSLPDAVFDQLVAGIVEGELAVGDALPSERRLAETLQVSRPAVREALQRLAQAGLVDIRHGDATTVNDYRRAAGLDLLPRLLMRRDGTVDIRVARSIVEARGAVGPQVARLAAEHAGPELAERLEAILERMAASDDPVELQQDALDLWDCVVDASGNLVFRLMFNALSAAYAPVLETLANVMAREVRDTAAYRRLADAIVSGDGDAATAAADAVLQPGTQAVLATIDLLLAPDDEAHDEADDAEHTDDPDTGARP